MTINPNILLITGPSGVGKTTLARKLCQCSSYKRWPSVTTRRPRPDERDGIDYHFVDETTFLEMLKRKLFLEHIRSVDNVFYGLPKPAGDLLETDACLVAIVNFDAAQRLKYELAPQRVEIRVLDAPMDVLIERVTSRGDSNVEIKKRIKMMECEQAKIKCMESFSQLYSYPCKVHKKKSMMQSRDLMSVAKM